MQHTDALHQKPLIHADPSTQDAGRARVTAFTVAGAFVGDDDACSDRLLALMRAKLAPLGYVAKFHDTEKVKCSALLAVHLLRLVASAIPTHWMRAMPPHQTAAAAAYIDTAVADAFAAIVRAHDSPDERAGVAIALSNLPARMGGFGLAAFARSAHACFAAAFIAAWPTCRAVSPDHTSPASTPPTPPPPLSPL